MLLKTEIGLAAIDFPRGARTRMYLFLESLMQTVFVINDINGEQSQYYLSFFSCISSAWSEINKLPVISQYWFLVNANLYFKF